MLFTGLIVVFSLRFVASINCLHGYEIVAPPGKLIQSSKNVTLTTCGREHGSGPGCMRTDVTAQGLYEHF